MANCSKPPAITAQRRSQSRQRPGSALASQALDHATSKVLVGLITNHCGRNSRWVLDQPLRNRRATPEPVAFARRPFDRRTIYAMQMAVGDGQRWARHPDNLARRDPVEIQPCLESIEHRQPHVDQPQLGRMIQSGKRVELLTSAYR